MPPLPRPRPSPARTWAALAVLVLVPPAVAACHGPAPSETEEAAEEFEETRQEDPAPQEYEGSGDTVLEIDEPHDDIGLARISHTGGGNFAVWTVDSSGNTSELLVNEIGDYEGSVLYNVDAEESAALEITADGPWNIALEPLSAAREWTGSAAAGAGDEVLRLAWEPEGLESIAMSHSGEANFAVWAYGEGRDLLANEIGDYEGEALLPPGTEILGVTADGEWELHRG